jgi:hypothetical protein
MSKSEVTLIREWIDCEVAALQRLRDFSQSASHETIMHHYRILDVCHAGLAAEIGEEKATDAICERINKR